MLNERLLKTFMNGFYGYGEPKANLWFVGMEEGGGKTEDEIELHLRTWDQRGRNVVEDLRDFQLAKSPDNPLFSDVPKPQRTWKRLCLIELALRGDEGPLSDALQHQANSLGRQAGGNMLLELLPLPKPSRDPEDWKYGTWTTISWLRQHDSYEKRVSAGRIKAIKALLDEHRPRVIVFYGLTFRKYWQQLGLIRPQKVPIGKAGKSTYITRSDRAVFVAVNHPADRLPDSYFVGVGEHLRGLGVRA